LIASILSVIPIDIMFDFSTSEALENTLVVIDGSIEDSQQLLSGLDPRLETVFLQTHENGITQISEVLADRRDIETIHLVTHGDSGSLQLGNATLDNANIDEFADVLTDWGESLSENADILLYGCNAGEGEAGRRFLDRFSQLTDADMAASDDITGSAALGGDWDLEVQIGTVDSTVAFDRSTQRRYRRTLATFNVAAGDTVELIDAIETANSTPEDDVIELETGTYTLTTIHEVLDGGNALPSVEARSIGGTLTINGNDSIVEYNSPSLEKSRVFYVRENADLTLSDLTVRGGRSDSGFPEQGGGGLFNRGTATLNNTTFTDNQAPSGGAIHNSFGGMLIVADSQFQGNETDSGGSGGAVFNEGTVEIANSSIDSGNTAEIGGGISSIGGLLSISNSTIDNNEAALTGGGISVETTSLSLRNSTVSNNVAFGAEVGGGGIEAFDSIISIVNSTISGNRLPGNPTLGGGILAVGASGIATIVNSTIVDNEATDSGAGISSQFGTTVILQNSIVANNTTSSGGDDVAGAPGSIVSQGFNFIGVDRNGNFTAAGDLAGSESFPLDPRLNPLQDNGGATLTHLPLDDSPVIDAGSDALAIDPATSLSLTGDQRGFRRFAGEFVDIGALEIQDDNLIELVESGGSTRVLSGFTSDTYEIVFNLQPIFDVTVELSANTLNLEPTTLTFTPNNWNVPQLVTVATPRDVETAEFSISHTVTSEDLAFDGLGVDDLVVSAINPIETLGVETTLPEGAVIGFTEDDDIITGSLDRDAIYGRNGNDILFGDGEVDRLYGNDGNDYLNGGDATDYLNGGDGDDELDGEAGIDVLFGGDGFDRLRGGSDDDLLFGENGDDELFGGSGRDTLTGGLGNDVFVLGRDGSTDTIQDFQIFQDKISLTNGLTFEDLEFTLAVDPDVRTVVRDRVTGQEIAVLVGVVPGSISESDFI